MKKSLNRLAVLAILGGLVGCGSQDQTSVAEKTTSAGVSETSTDTEAAASSPTAPSALPVRSDSPPESVVAAFLDSIRDGRETVALELLTTIARAETAKHKLSVQPPGSPAVSYRIGEVRLVRGGAHVHSIWTEPSEQGEPIVFDVTWVLRQQPEGWRVAGMATELVPGEPPVFLNFEDPADMLAKWDEAESKLAAQADEAAAVQAAAPQGEITR